MHRDKQITGSMNVQKVTTNDQTSVALSWGSRL